MRRTKFPPEQIVELSNSVAAYIAEQRDFFMPNARPVTPEYKRLLSPFFPADILDQVRVIRGRASEPSFYPKLKTAGIRKAPRFSQMAGITFQNVVVHVEPITEALLFHELVTLFSTSILACRDLQSTMFAVFSEAALTRKFLWRSRRMS